MCGPTFWYGMLALSTGRKPHVSSKQQDYACGSDSMSECTDGAGTAESQRKHRHLAQSQGGRRPAVHPWRVRLPGPRCSDVQEARMARSLPGGSSERPMHPFVIRDFFSPTPLLRVDL